MTISRVGTDQSAVSASSPFNVAFPSSIAAGNLLILEVTANSAAPTVSASGFTVLDQYANSTCSLTILGKYATGSESGNLSVSVSSGTRMCASLKARQGSGIGFSQAPLVNFSAFQHDTAASGKVITTTAMTGVPSGAWLEAAGGGTGISGTTCTVSGTNWTERTDSSEVSGITSCQLDTADNATDTGTAHTCTFTWADSQSLMVATSFYITEAKKMLAGGVAAYTWTGGAATLLYAHRLVGGVAAYAWSVAAAKLLQAHKLVGGVASYTWAGATVSFLRAYTLVASIVWSWAVAAARLIPNDPREYVESPDNSPKEELKTPDDANLEQVSAAPSDDKEQLRTPRRIG